MFRARTLNIAIICFSIWLSCFQCSVKKDPVKDIQPLQMMSASPTFMDEYQFSDSSLNNLVKIGVRDIVISDTVIVEDDIVIPYGHSLEIRNGGMITSLEPYKLEIYGNFKAGNVMVFGDKLNIIFGAGSVERANVTWFGALADTQLVIGVEGDDDTEQIQRAINSAEFVKNVFFPSYRVGF